MSTKIYDGHIIKNKTFSEIYNILISENNKNELENIRKKVFYNSFF